VGAREPQLGMFETIREYAWEQLVDHADAEPIRRRHALYYLKFAQEARETPLIGATVGRLRREHDNLRAALQWACDRGESTLGLQLAVALARFWRSYGYGSEGRAWFAQLLALEHGEDTISLALRQQALHASAWLASDQQDYLQATRLFEEWAAVRRAMGIIAGETDLLLNEARKARTEGNYRRARTLYEGLYSRYRAMEERIVADDHGQELSFEEVGQVLRELGLVRREQGDFAGAAALFAEGLRLHRASGDRASTAFSLLGLADVARDQGEAVAVGEYADTSLAILRELGMRWAIGFALNTLAQGAIVAGDLHRAALLIHESVALFRDLNASGSLTEILITYATVLRLQGEIAAAESALRESAQLARAGGPRLFLAAALEGLGCLVIERGEAVPGLQLLATASSLRADMGTPERPIDRPRLEAAKADARLQIGPENVAVVWSTTLAQPEEHVLDAFLLPG
jgi:tetratricopeptide (TPR) repeat protein